MYENLNIVLQSMPAWAVQMVASSWTPLVGTVVIIGGLFGICYGVEVLLRRIAAHHHTPKALPH